MNINTTLKDYIEHGNCIYDIMGKSQNIIPDEKIKLYSILNKYIRNPTKIHFINLSILHLAIKKLCKLSNKQLRPFFTSCIFCLNGKKCSNHKNNRYITIKFKIKDKEILLDLCYPDISKCRNRITFGFHIDFSFTYNGKNLRIYDAKNFITPNKKRIRQKQVKTIVSTQICSNKDTHIKDIKRDKSINDSIDNSDDDSTKKTDSHCKDLISIKKKTLTKSHNHLIKYLNELEKIKHSKINRMQKLETEFQTLQNRYDFTNKDFFDTSFNYSLSIQ
tara:strand:+ start:445 stop:1272 length:828 start_codon:yes stop_codon:yes gene_type:complete